MEEKIANKLWELLKWRDKLLADDVMYALRNARLSGAITLAKELGFEVDFNPLADKEENPFTVKEIKG